MTPSRYTHLSRSYIRLNLVYTEQAFIYLLTGLLIFLINGILLLGINTDSVYILWLFGFVSSMIFGITNIMVPSYGNWKEFPKGRIAVEIICLNLGTIISFIGLNLESVQALFGLGILLLIIAVLIHLVDMTSSRMSREDTD